jgi:hypothetical protein
VRHRPLATAAAAALVIGALAGPAAARGTVVSTAKPAAGTATSALNVLSLALAGHSVQVGGVALTSDTVTGSPVAKVVVTPLKVDGTAYGEQSVTPANSPATVPVVDSASAVPAALAGLASVKSPVIDVSASNSDGASSKAGAASLGSVSVLGIPVKLDGTVNVASLVNSSNALGEKTVAVKNLALPSVADLLAALGLDLSAVPVDVLSKLLSQLGLVNTAVTAAQQALDQAMVPIKAQVAAAQAQVDAAQAQLNAATAALPGQLSALDSANLGSAQKQAAVATAQTAANSATAAQSTAAAAITAALPLGTTFNQFLVLFPASPLVTAYNDATALVTSTATALANANTAAAAAQAALAAAQAAVNAAQKLVTDLQATLDGLLATLKTLLASVQPLIDSLLAAITAVLDGTPLVSIDSITVQTQALVKSATAGGQVAKVTGGEIVGLKVLGTDVLNNVLGNTKIDLLDLAGSTLTSVTSKINALTGTLSSVLSNVPSLPTLSIPAPQIGVLTKSASTDIAGGFGLAQNSVKALTVTIPAITLPAAVALPNAAALPAISGLPTSGLIGGLAVGDLVSKPITLGLVTLSEQSKFRPAVTAAPTTPPAGTPETPNLATTGASVGIAVFALVLTGFGLAMRRRRIDGTEV